MAVDWSKPIQTRYGVPMRVLCTDAPGEYPVIAISPSGGPYTYRLDGRWHKNFQRDNRDLINVPPPKRKLRVCLVRNPLNEDPNHTNALSFNLGDEDGRQSYEWWKTNRGIVWEQDVEYEEVSE